MERNKNDIDFPGKIAILLKEYRAISIKAEGGFVQILATALDIQPNDDVETVCEGISTKPIDLPLRN
jgi:hypothetical protein